ncbi:hypothetical protein ACWENS_05495 [Streptomyces sp. NPDC004532]
MITTLWQTGAFVALVAISTGVPLGHIAGRRATPARRPRPTTRRKQP